MKREIKDLLQNYQNEKVALSEHHEAAFITKLQRALHPQKKNKKRYQWISIAASVAILISVGVSIYTSKNKINPINTEKMIDIRERKITLGNVSPELHTIESYYTNSINEELSELEMTDENKDLLEGYLAKIEELTSEYKSLTEELNTNGVNDNTVNALIDNLKLRLQLLQQLQHQLNELKSLQTTKNA